MLELNIIDYLISKVFIMVIVLQIYAEEYLSVYKEEYNKIIKQEVDETLLDKLIVQSVRFSSGKEILKKFLVKSIFEWTDNFFTTQF